MVKIKNKKFAYSVMVVFGLLNIVLWPMVFKGNDQKLTAYFFDVGQGDASYFRTADSQDILIDGGPGSKVLSKLGEIMPYYDKKIELVILSHGHSDHVDGLVDILKRYDVGEVLYYGTKNDYAGYLELLNLIKEKNIVSKNVKAGDEVLLGQTTIKILAPINNVESDDLNNSSIVLRLIYGQNSIMMTGDAGMEIEKEILNNNADLKSDILKVGHHGSKYSSSVDFLEKVASNYGIIMVGLKNSYHHPHQTTLDNLNNSGIKVFRTDLDEDIKCVGDGIKINCNKL
ncbi:MAG: ComEC/Rec2 family competence protein [Patescibacteria group bacterium]|nr:ComEC/Rec2 family competence protein [Patescibacteria group bacterium]